MEFVLLLEALSPDGEVAGLLRTDMERAFAALFKERVQKPALLGELFFNKRDHFHGHAEFLHWLLLHCEASNTLEPLLLGFDSRARVWNPSEQDFQLSPASLQVLQEILATYGMAKKKHLKKEVALICYPRALNSRETEYLIKEMPRIITLLSNATTTSTCLEANLDLFKTLLEQMSQLPVHSSDDAFVRAALALCSQDRFTELTLPLALLLTKPMGDDFICQLVELYWLGGRFGALQLVFEGASCSMVVAALASRFGTKLVAELLCTCRHTPSLLILCRRLVFACEERDAAEERENLERICNALRNCTDTSPYPFLANIVRRLVKLEAFDYFLRLAATSSAPTESGLVLCAILKTLLDSFPDDRMMRPGFYFSLITTLLQVLPDWTKSDANNSVHLLVESFPALYFKLDAGKEREEVLRNLLPACLTACMDKDRARIAFLLLRFLTFPLLNNERLLDSKELAEFQLRRLASPPALPTCAIEFSNAEKQALRMHIVYALRACADEAERQALTLLCDLIPSTKESDLQTREALICLALQTLIPPSSFTSHPALVLGLENERAMRVNCIQIFCGRISNLLDEETLNEHDLPGACAWVTACLNGLYDEFTRKRVERIALLLNRPTQECNEICSMRCLGFVRGALTQALEIRFDCTLDVDVDVVESEDEQEEEGEEEDFCSLHELWAVNEAKSEYRQLLVAVSSLLQCAERLAGEKIGEKEEDAHVAKLTATQARIAVDAYFSNLFDDWPPGAVDLLQADRLALVQFVGLDVERARLVHVNKPVLRETMLLIFAETSFAICERSVTPILNVLAASLDSIDVLGCLGPALLNYLRNIPKEQQQLAAVDLREMNLSKLLATCLKEKSFGQNAYMLQCVILLCSLDEILSWLRAGGTGEEKDAPSHACLFAFCKLLWRSDNMCAQEADRLKLVEFALERIARHGTSSNDAKEWILWIHNLAYPQPSPAGVDLTPVEVASREAESFSQLSSFIATKKLALANPRRSQAAPTSSLTAQLGGGVFDHHVPQHAHYLGHSSSEEEEEEQPSSEEEDDEFLLAPSSMQLFFQTTNNNNRSSRSSSSSSSNEGDEGGGASSLLDKLENRTYFDDMSESSSPQHGALRREERTSPTMTAEEEAMETSTRLPEPSAFAPVQEQVYRAANDVLLELSPNLTRCYGDDGKVGPRKAFRCMQCAVEPLCGVCAEHCHSTHDLLFLPATTSFTCACRADCAGKQARRDMDRLPVEYLQPLLLGKNLSASFPSPLQEEEDEQYSMVRTKLYFDMNKGGADANALKATQSRKLATARDGSGFFAVCEGNFLSMADFSQVLCMVAEDAGALSFSNLHVTMDVVEFSLDLQFYATCVEFSPYSAQHLLVAGVHKCVVLVTTNPNTNSEGGGLHVSLDFKFTVCEDTSEPILRAIWVSPTQICIVAESGIKIYDIASALMRASATQKQQQQQSMASFAVHGEVLVDAAMLDKDNLLLLCQSGCVLKHTITAHAQENEEQEMVLYNYILFHATRVAYSVTGLVVISPQTILILSSLGAWRVVVDDATRERTESNELVLSVADLGMTFQPCLYVQDRWLVAPCKSPEYASALSFTDIPRVLTHPPPVTGPGFCAQDRIVGLADWNSGERVVAMTESGVIFVYWITPSLAKHELETAPRATIFQHLELARAPMICAKAAYSSTLRTPITTPEQTRQLLSKSADTAKTLLSGGGEMLMTSGKELEINIGVLEEEADSVICALHLTFGMDHLPRSVQLFNRSFGLEMKHAATNDVLVGATLQIVLTLPEILLCRQTRALRIRLVSGASGGYGPIAIRGMDVYTLQAWRIPLLYARPGRFDDNRTGQIIALRDLPSGAAAAAADAIRKVGLAALRFPLAAPRHEKALDWLRTRCTLALDTILPALAFAKLCGVECLVETARRGLAGGAALQARVCDALLALFHGPICLPRGLDPILVQNAYSCDACQDFPIREFRMNCPSCEDFDVCSACYYRTSFKHHESHGALVRHAIEPMDCVYCQHCGQVVGTTNTASTAGALCSLCASLHCEPSAEEPAVHAIIHPQQVCRLLLSQTEQQRDVVCFDLIRFLVLSCVICHDDNETAQLIKRKILDIPELALKLRCMAYCQAHLSNTFTEAEVLQVINEVDGNAQNVSLLFPSLIELCKHARRRYVQDDRLALAFRHVYVASFPRLTLETKRLGFSLLRHEFNARESYQALVKSSAIYGLIHRLLAEAGELDGRERVVACIKTVRELHALAATTTTTSGNAVWSRLRFDRAELASALMHVAVRFIELGVDDSRTIAACVELVRWEDFPLPDFAQRFLQNHCLLHEENALLRSAARKVLGESSTRRLDLASFERCFALAESKASTVSVDFLLLLAEQCSNALLPVPAERLAQRVLDLLQEHCAERTGKWDEHAPVLHLAQGAAAATASSAASIPPLQLLFSTSRTTGSVCLDCAPPIERQYTAMLLDTMGGGRAASYESHAVSYKLERDSDVQCVTVSFSSNITTIAAVAGIRGLQPPPHHHAAAASALSMIQAVKVYVDDECVGELSSFELQSGSVKLYTASLYLEPCVPHGCTLRFEFCLAKSVLQEQRCPRCARLVVAHHHVSSSSHARDVTCMHCGEMLNQCRQCRTINYGDNKALFCDQCGHCRLLKISFSAHIRASLGRTLPPLASQREYEACRKAYLDVLVKKERAEAGRLFVVREPALRALRENRFLAVIPLLAPPVSSSLTSDLYARYRDAYFSSVEASAARARLLGFRLAEDKRAEVAAKTTTTAAHSCFTCDLAFELALFTLLVALAAASKTTTAVVDVVRPALPWLFERAEHLELLRLPLPKQQPQQHVFQTGLDCFTEVVLVNPEMLNAAALTLVQKSRSAFAVQVLDRLLERYGAQEECAAAAAAALYVVENFIREGVHVVASIQIMQRYATSAVAASKQPSLSPVVKRMRAASSDSNA